MNESNGYEKIVKYLRKYCFNYKNIIKIKELI